MKRPKQITFVFGTALLAVALAACSSANPTGDVTQGSDPVTQASSTPQGDARTPESPADSASPASDPAYGSPEGGTTLAPVALGETASTGQSADQGISFVVTGWHDVTMPAGMPGEIAGPGLAFEMTATNNTDAPLDLNGVIADLRVGADQTPTLYTTREPTKPFTGTLQPGQSASATYAFNLDAEQRSDLMFYITLTADLPVVVFHGSAN